MWSNLANHVLSLCHKHWDGHVPDVDESALRPADLDLIAATQNGFNPVGAELKTIDSLKMMFSLFLPFTSEKLHTFFGNETPQLNQPAPLFKKLEESVIEEERARLGD